MEFKYRAVDDRPTPTPTSYPLSTVTYVSERSLKGGGYESMASTAPNTTFRMPVAKDAGEALRRELEKEQIRREIIAGEFARRRELEEEVRRELAMERVLGIPMQRSLGGPHGFSLEERVAMLLNPRLNPFDGNIFGVPQQPQLPQIMAPPEIKPSLQIMAPSEVSTSQQSNNDKVIVLAKPNLDLHGAKRKAVTPPAVDGSKHSPLKKKPKEEWSCALCQVSATNERGLNAHLQGRKHKAKEAALRMQKIGLDAEWGDTNQTTVDKGVMESKNGKQLVQKGENTCLENMNGTAIVKDAGKKNTLRNRKSKFWCEICEVGTCSLIVMEGHKKGRKHLTRMKKFSRNDESDMPTSPVSPEAPGSNKATDAINKESDQKMTPVLNEETVSKMAESFSDSDN